MNPLYSIGDDANKHTNPSKAVNSDQPKTSVFESTLDLSRACFKTQAFGQYEPFEVIDVVAKDVIPLATSHNVRSLPTNAPQLNPLKLNKDFFFVPMQAILPRTWEYIFRQPSQGDDVPDDAMCHFSFLFIDSWFTHISQYVAKSTTTSVGINYLWFALSMETILSRGSLVNMLGKTFNRDFDAFVDEVLSLDYVMTFETLSEDVSTNLTYSTSAYPGGKVLERSRFFDLVRHYPESVKSLSFIVEGAKSDTSPQLRDIYVKYLGKSVFTPTNFGKVPIDTTNPDAVGGTTSGHDIRRVLAYQVVCSQFYTRGNIDSIYNAQLWRDNLFSLFKLLDPSISPDFMTVNGTLLEYDICSQHYFDLINTVLINNYPPTSAPAGNKSRLIYEYLQYIFGLRTTLIFGDYFTDSRTQPLATDDYNLPDANISVFDVNKSLVLQRFRNTVVKLKNSFTDYLKSVFNSLPSPDYHFPKYIRGYEATISGNEVAGTTPENNGQLVQNFVTGGSDEVVEVEIDMPGIILGISYFTIPPLYMNYQERFWLHQSRHDDYNPMLQYLGDQKVYSLELNRSGSSHSDSFAYNSRYAEYKQRYGVVSGAVGTSKLPGWVFVLDDKHDPVRKDIDHMNSRFIRFLPSDYDQMFPTLSGLSLGNRFHFIVMYNNQCVASRNMLVNPQTLL